MKNICAYYIETDMFTRTYVPTSTRTVWESPHQNLSQTQLADPANQGKLLYNDTNGEIAFFDYTFLDDVEVFPTIAQFPVTGDESKMYLDQATSRVYRWAGGQYFFVPHDVYAKNEVYNKNETDNKYVGKNSANNMTNGSVQNLTALDVAGTVIINQSGTEFLRPINAGLQPINYVSTINNQLQFHPSALSLSSDLNLQNNHIVGGQTINSSKVRTSYLEAQNGQPMISLNDTAGINCHGKELRNCSIVQATQVQLTGGPTMMVFDGANINFTGKNLINSSTLNTGALETDNVRRTNGTNMILFPNDGEINCQNKVVRNAIVLSNELKHVSGTTMVSFPNPNRIDMNNKDLINVASINGATLDGMCLYRSENVTVSGQFLPLIEYFAPSGFAICSADVYLPNGGDYSYKIPQAGKSVTDSQVVMLFDNSVPYGTQLVLKLIVRKV